MFEFNYLEREREREAVVKEGILYSSPDLTSSSAFATAGSYNC